MTPRSDEVLVGNTEQGVCGGDFNWISDLICNDLATPGERRRLSKISASIVKMMKLPEQSKLIRQIFESSVV